MNSRGNPLTDETAALRMQLAAAREALEEFNHSISHDLRAPLRHVRSYIKIAQDELGGQADPAVREHLRTAGDAALRMGHMLEALLELSRLGRVDLMPVACAMGDLVAETRSRVGDLRASQVRWEVAHDFPPLQADPALLRQLLQQLLDNAIKFSRGVPQPRIEVGWRMAEPGWCELFVRDNGVGFEQRFADRLFRLFQRLHAQQDYEGVGAGLAVARRIVERHGGRIRARGDLAPGCEVVFTLPLAGAAEPATE